MLKVKLQSKMHHSCSIKTCWASLETVKENNKDISNYGTFIFTSFGVYITVNLNTTID